MQDKTMEGKSIQSGLATVGAGFLFAIGLALSGMTQPSKVIGFLDVTGAWDPSLIFVMGGAVGLNLITFRLILKRPKPLLEERFDLPWRKKIDVPLVLGAALFGAGWGLSGYCPGPALVSLSASLGSSIRPLVFVAAMMAGFAIEHVAMRSLSGLNPSADPTSAKPT